jgi:hypothetical protein
MRTASRLDRNLKGPQPYRNSRLPFGVLLMLPVCCVCNTVLSPLFLLHRRRISSGDTQVSRRYLFFHRDPSTIHNCGVSLALLCTLTKLSKYFWNRLVKSVGAPFLGKCSFDTIVPVDEALQRMSIIANARRTIATRFH